MDFKQKYISDADKQSPDQVFLNQLAEKMKETAENGNFEESIPTRIIKYKNNKIPSVIAACAVFMLCTAAGLYFSTHRKNDINLITTEISSTTSVTAAVQTTSEQKQHFSETTVLPEIILPSETTPVSEKITQQQTVSYHVTENTSEYNDNMIYSSKEISKQETRQNAPVTQKSEEHITSVKNTTTNVISETTSEYFTSAETTESVTETTDITEIPGFITEKTIISEVQYRDGKPVFGMANYLYSQCIENGEPVYTYVYPGKGYFKVVKSEPTIEEAFAEMDKEAEKISRLSGFSFSEKYYVECDEPFAVIYTVSRAAGDEEISHYIENININFNPEYFVDYVNGCIYDYITGELISSQTEFWTQ